MLHLRLARSIHSPVLLNDPFSQLVLIALGEDIPIELITFGSLADLKLDTLLFLPSAPLLEQATHPIINRIFLNIISVLDILPHLSHDLRHPIDIGPDIRLQFRKYENSIYCYLESTMTRKYRNLFLVLVVVALDGEAQVGEEGFFAVVKGWLVFGVGKMRVELLEAGLEG